MAVALFCYFLILNFQLFKIKTMKSIQRILMAITLLLSVVGASAQIKNSVTEKVKINGNCGMCKSNIEKAGSVKKIATVVWDKDTKMATLTYDSKVTSQDEILKRVAAAGYDSARFKAADEVYNNLHGCCQYDRETSLDTAPAVKKESEN